MKISRAVNFGMAYARLIVSYAEELPGEERNEYLWTIIKGLEKLEFKTRRKGEPKKPEHRRALEDLTLDRISIQNPESVTNVLDELCQLMYSAQRAGESKRGFLKVLNTENDRAPRRGEGEK